MYYSDNTENGCGKILNWYQKQPQLLFRFSRSSRLATATLNIQIFQ